MSISRQRGAFSAIRRQKASAERRYACVFFLAWRKIFIRCWRAYKISGSLKRSHSFWKMIRCVVKNRL